MFLANPHRAIIDPSPVTTRLCHLVRPGDKPDRYRSEPVSGVTAREDAGPTAKIPRPDFSMAMTC
jgi:hypothetical protein